MQSYLFLQSKRRQAEEVNQLVIHTSAAQGDPKAIKKKVRQLQRDL